ncbi:MAG: class I SAM-dependent methyltransferase [Nitrospirae bacterium]|nr:class I SAM-dependent methyltransferase [Nitrospirota bacterium]
MLRFGQAYFDSDLGYGGYYYDGRWGTVAEAMIRHYDLKPGQRILDVGCAKGFLAYEFQRRLGADGAPVAFGCDISAYALRHAKAEVRGRFSRMSAHALGFADHSFDLVVSIGTLHNLDEDRADQAVRELMRVSRGLCFLNVASYASPAEEEGLHDWGATVQVFRSMGEWHQCFERIGYGGDYSFSTFTFSQEPASAAGPSPAA